MKKVIAVFFTVAVCAITTKVSAQQFIARLTTTGNQPMYSGSGLKLKEGQNIVMVKELTGTLIIVQSGGDFSSVIYKDASGNSTRLTPTAGGANGAPKPECKTKLPDVCFATADKNIGMCICKPGNISNGSETYSITMLFAAEQKTRVSNGATLQVQGGHH